MKWVYLLLFIFISSCNCFAQPPARHLERIAYDSRRNKLIMFGGSAFVDNQLINYTTLHEWDGMAWKEFDTPGPSPRNGGALVYNDQLGITFLFGGTFEDKNGFKIFYDGWTWNGVIWSPLQSTCPVKDPEAVYDSRRKQILMYGEVTNKETLQPINQQKFELWSYKNDTWKKLSEGGPVPSGPFQMTFDESINALLIPVADGDKMVVWEWKNEIWSKRTCNESCPPPRSRFAFAYDKKSKKSYLHGGRGNTRDFLNDVWEWDGISWKNVIPTVPLQPKASARMVYGKNSILEFGGAVTENGKTILINEIWEFRNKSWMK